MLFYDFSPDIDFTTIWELKCKDGEHVKVTLIGSHNLFPNYEGLLENKNLYEFRNKGDGLTPVNLWGSISISPPRTQTIKAER